jgi:type 1 glutamine amidotransferase
MECAAGILLVMGVVAATIVEAAALEKVPPDEAGKILAAVPGRARVKPVRPRAVLVFTLTRGFRHDSIPLVAYAIEQMGKKTGAFKTVVSDDIAMFSPENIAKFDAVVMDNTTGELFLPPDFDRLSPSDQEKARKRDGELKASFLDFVRSGKGLVGIHAATDCFYQWPEYGDMIGGYFAGHPWNEKIGVAIDDPGHPLCAVFGGQGFEVGDEIYMHREPYSRDLVRVLLRMDREKTPEKGDRPDNDYALAWVRNYGKGRVFYCAFGHWHDIFMNPKLMQFYLDGIQFALGDLLASAEPTGARGPVDPIMGEYEGTYTPGKGLAAKASAKVVAEGDGRYLAALEAGAMKAELKGKISGREVKLDRPSEGDCVVGWSVAGPYTKEGIAAEDLLDAVFPPEEPNGGGVQWKPVQPAPDKPGVIDLLKAVGGENRVAYLRAVVKSPAAQEAELSLGSDDGVKVWLNGALVHANNAMRGYAPDQDRVNVKLAKGGNVLLVKVSQGGGDWAAGAALKPSGGRLEGVLGGKNAEASLTGRISGGSLVVSGEGRFDLKRVDRRSPTEGAKPLSGAVVLLPFGSGPPSLDEWTNANWVPRSDGSVLVRGGDSRTKRDFGDMKMHLEFMVPYMPGARGQGRGNSGVYLMDRYEVQVLDSFGLPLASNECGGIYQVAVPKVNACLPPAAWQTYDIVFRAPRLKSDGSVAKPAEVTVEQNGILIHDRVRIPGPTGGGAEGNVARAPLKLQDHGNPVRYRNIWLVELKDEAGK